MPRDFNSEQEIDVARIRSRSPAEAPTVNPIDIGAERLRILADFLPSVPERQFNLIFWAEGPRIEECGTAACACGWATTIPAFRAVGLKLDTQLGMGIIFGELLDWEAVTTFFGLTHHEAEHLFSAERYGFRATPAIVAARIREHLAERSAKASAQ